MLGHLYENQDCSASRALEVVGERWSLLILRDAMFRGSTRFGDFVRVLEIAPNILTSRLNGFVANGLMTTQPNGEYHLTDKGRELMPVILALGAWGDKWVRPGPVEYIHRASGEAVAVELRRAGDGGAVGVDEVGVRVVETAGP